MRDARENQEKNSHVKSWGEKHVCFSLPGSRVTLFLCHARRIKPIVHYELSERWTTRSLFFCLLSSFPTFPLLPFSSVPFSCLSLCFPLVSSLPFRLYFRTFQSSLAFCSVCSTVFVFVFHSFISSFTSLQAVRGELSQFVDEMMITDSMVK